MNEVDYDVRLARLLLNHLFKKKYININKYL
jgi:hypothetical protein